MKIINLTRCKNCNHLESEHNSWGTCCNKTITRTERLKFISGYKFVRCSYVCNCDKFEEIK